jgi:hypothetical protein
MRTEWTALLYASNPSSYLSHLAARIAVVSAVEAALVPSNALRPSSDAVGRGSLGFSGKSGVVNAESLRLLRFITYEAVRENRSIILVVTMIVTVTTMIIFIIIISLSSP